MDMINENKNVFNASVSDKEPDYLSKSERANGSTQPLLPEQPVNTTVQFKKVVKDSEVTNEAESSIIVKNSKDVIRERLESIQGNEFQRLQKIRNKELLLNRTETTENTKGLSYDRAQDNSIQSNTNRKEVMSADSAERKDNLTNKNDPDKVLSVFRSSENLEEEFLFSQTKNKKNPLDQKDEQQDENHDRGQNKRSMQDIYDMFDEDDDLFKSPKSKATNGTNHQNFILEDLSTFNIPRSEPGHHIPKLSSSIYQDQPLQNNRSYNKLRNKFHKH